ncbi:glycosyltransferase [Janibacter cremeus]|uniref:CDP-glycerol glycerophosphotransferase (TagB/SpsB family)/glycosyltransferase involved in cell wall biosynthesis n=1 Tax=Janibacter cremeus TaxID=1285192 RepID=A0A852VLN4_9MICO|nr:glycosyltransferase [Janibacter cremeus]NYF97987.1 CDP-glycerol glycerophosphotransferase (TagB/SpsB family)/glycosyltransferase involved in cell wall biosynthesis [Janibacter cremeus]
MLRVTDAVKSMQRARQRGSQEWRAFWLERPVDPNLVVYESFAGNGVLCNPEAIFRALVDDPEFAHLTHIWCLSREAWSSGVRAEFAQNPNVRFVRYKSPQYWQALATAGYVFNNTSFPPEFTKRDGQIYVNTWHGVPLKTMGYDEPNGGTSARNVLRNFLAADYLLAANSFMAERMYESAYRLTNIYPGHIITEGSPRVDRQFLNDSGRRRVRRRLQDAGVRLGDNQKVVLYAPTWRGESFHRPTNDTARLATRVRELKRQLPADQQVLLRVHQQVYDFAIAHPELADILVPNEIPSNEVLGVTDVLVTDYSSIFFDFLATGRPIVFFTPDMRAYDGYRGLYLDPKDLPGPVVHKVGELARSLVAVGTGEGDDPAVSHRRAYQEARERFAALEDGEATRRVVDIVFRGNTSGHDIRPARSDGRARILMYLGGMRSNGIMTSALNLLNNIDHDRFDVSVFYQHSSSKQVLGNVAKIHPRVRLVPRVGGMIWSLRSEGERSKALHGGQDVQGESLERAERMFAQEWRRCFGLAEFDHIVDFSGYAAFWARLLRQGPAKDYSIWLHNDLMADQMKVVNGKQPHVANLGSVFSAYAGYDNLVSVSEALMEINKEINKDNLAAAAPKAKHTFARNTIDADYITRMAFGDLDGDRVESASEAVPAGDLPLAVRTLSEVHGMDRLEGAVQRRRTISDVIPPADGVRTFVTVGRLSPEKNHERLIRAFDIVHQVDPNTRLVIIGGGPLEHDLVELTHDLGLGEAVTVAGQQSNPHVILSKADVFVLSSDYEGQPMVILEARVLGLPVVATNFASVGGALPPGVGRIVERDEEALAEGMAAALRGEVPNPTFDAVAYNAEATQDFYRVIGAAGSVGRD